MGKVGPGRKSEMRKPKEKPWQQPRARTGPSKDFNIFYRIWEPGFRSDLSKNNFILLFSLTKLSFANNCVTSDSRAAIC